MSSNFQRGVRITPVRILTIARDLMNLYGLQDWAVLPDQAKGRRGRCCYETRIIFLSMQTLPFIAEHRVIETILHEMAHALDKSHCGHGLAWAMILASMGETPRRYYDPEECE